MLLMCVSIVIIICNPEHVVNEPLPGHGDAKSPEESEQNVEMQRYGAYEVVRLSRQKVTMKDNPAYVDVTLA